MRSYADTRQRERWSMPPGRRHRRAGGNHCQPRQGRSRQRAATPRPPARDWLLLLHLLLLRYARTKVVARRTTHRQIRKQRPNRTSQSAAEAPRSTWRPIHRSHQGRSRLSHTRPSRTTHQLTDQGSGPVMPLNGVRTVASRHVHLGRQARGRGSSRDDHGHLDLDETRSDERVLADDRGRCGLVRCDDGVRSPLAPAPGADDVAHVQLAGDPLEVIGDPRADAVVSGARNGPADGKELHDDFSRG